MTKKLTNRVGSFPASQKEHVSFSNMSFHKKIELLRAFDVFAVIYTNKIRCWLRKHSFFSENSSKDTATLQYSHN